MFQLKTEDRLRSWREFRHSIGHLPMESALKKTADLWATVPFTPYHLDINTPHNWSTPWQLIEDNIYCDLAKCLGIVYTMSLTSHKTNFDVEIRLYKDMESGYEYNLAWFNDGKYILNLMDREIVNINQFDKTLKLKKQYKEQELQLEY
jgi:hypothetical protein